jgi:hypothetical protein
MLLYLIKGSDMKVCTKCKIEKEETEFSKHKKNKRDGLDTHCKACKSEYKRANRDSIARWQSEYNKANRDKKNAWQRDKIKTDPIFRLTKNLRIRTNKSLRRNSKSAHTTELIGCTVEEFRAHIESLFTEGMTWDNYGRNGWHLDHIKPCSAFNLNDPEEQRQCYHWSNQQPLWAKDNLSKGDKWDHSEEKPNELV